MLNLLRKYIAHSRFNFISLYITPKSKTMWHYTPDNSTEAWEKFQTVFRSDALYSYELHALSKEDQAEFFKILTLAIEELNRENSRLMGLMGQTSRQPVNRLVWEDNHLKITRTISSALANTGRMPNQAYIAQTTGLSRKTVSEHLSEAHDKSIYIEHLRQFTIMAPRVMDSVLNQAVLEQDTKAARLYFDILEKMNGPSAPNIYAGRNNYIYINNYVIRQETLRRLSDDQLKQIVEMVRKKDDDMIGEEITEVEESKEEKE
jgi:hypothetical protein